MICLKKKKVQILDQVPENKLGYIFAYVQGIVAYEDDDLYCNKLCEEQRIVDLEGQIKQQTQRITNLEGRVSLLSKKVA